MFNFLLHTELRPVFLSDPFPFLSSYFQEHRSEIDARAGTFQAFEMFGHQLLANNHYESPQVQEKLTDMNKARDDLEKYV